VSTPARSSRASPGAGTPPDALGLLRNDVLLEWYRYPPGPPVVLPSHAHQEYQLNLNLEVPGGVHYRGAYHVVPPGTLSIIMPGEAHTPRDPDGRVRDSNHLTLYVHPNALRDAAGALDERRVGEPAFRELLVDNTALIQRFVRLHARLAAPFSTLDQDVRLLDMLTNLVARYSGVRASSRSMPTAHRAVRIARDYLHENLTASISLAELAQVSGLSPYRLTRLFSASIGIPPHSYQIQLRIELAKRRLLAGGSVSDIGYDVGFFDLSHFTRHFRRYVGVAPGVYARGAQRDRRSPRG
jgi:AraC-like DNA-binding protein